MKKHKKLKKAQINLTQKCSQRAIIKKLFKKQKAMNKRQCMSYYGEKGLL